MWILLAFASAFFAGITSILAKCGIKNTDSHVATALRTIIVLIFAWLIVFVTGVQDSIFDVDQSSWVFLILSGIATGASWLCYFKALQIGDIHKVVAIDKSSTILTMILALIILHEEITYVKMICICLIGIGTYFMIEKPKDQIVHSQQKGWLLYACLSALFASLTSILAKIGIQNIDSNLATAIRTGVVLIMAWMIILINGKYKTIKTISLKEFIFIGLSAIATGASWLCYYKALQDGYASVVVPIDKLSILITIAFSFIVFHEKLTLKAFCGLILIVIGTLLLII